MVLRLVTCQPIDELVEREVGKDTPLYGSEKAS